MTLQPYSVTSNILADVLLKESPCTDLGQMQTFAKYKQARRPPPTSLCSNRMHNASRNVNSNSDMLLLMPLGATNKDEHSLVNMQLDPSKNPIFMPYGHMGTSYTLQQDAFVCVLEQQIQPYPPKQA